MKRDFLWTEEGRQYLLEEYVVRERSTYDIAQERFTYANKVRRALLHHGFALRDKSAAQLAATRARRHDHPTKGRPRSAEERHAISQGLSRAWQALPEERRRERVEAGRRRMQAMPEEERRRLLALANEGLRRAAAEGSRLERAIVKRLRAKGREPIRSACIDGRTQVDILLSRERVAIAVDGPSHHLPVWGEDQLARTAEADAAQTRELLAAGYLVVRVKCLAETPSPSQRRAAVTRLLEIVRSAEAEFPPPESRLVELEVA